MGDYVDDLGNVMPAPGNGRPKRARIDKQGNFVAGGGVYAHNLAVSPPVRYDVGTSSGAAKSVQAFGAVGDGVTDDTLAIQAAFDAGGVIIFAPGTYLISSTLQITSRRVVIHGNGADITGLNLPLLLIDTTTFVNINDLEFSAPNAVYAAGSAVVKVVAMQTAVWSRVRIDGVAETLLEFASLAAGDFIVNNTFIGVVLVQNTLTGNVCANLGCYTTAAGATTGNKFYGGLFTANSFHADLTHVKLVQGSLWVFDGCSFSGSGNVARFATLGAATTYTLITECEVSLELRGLIDESGTSTIKSNPVLFSVDTLQTYEVVASAGFAIGDIITGGTSGYTARVFSLPSATSMVLAAKSNSNPFTYGETITGAPSGASTTIRILAQIGSGIKEGSGSTSVAALALKNGTSNVTASFLQQNTNFWNAMFINPSGGAGNRGIFIQQRSNNGIMIECEAYGTDVFVVDGAGVVNATGEYRIDGTKVIGNRVVDGAVAGVINTGDATTDAIIGAIRSALDSHGLLKAV